MEFFEDATLYSEFSNLQKKDAQRLFKECVEKNQSELSSCENVLDIGCGTGESLIEFMLPSLKAECFKVTGIDVSKEMIEFAREKYESTNRSFHVFDIQSSLEVLDDSVKLGSFDLVTLSYCYQWVQDEKSVFVFNAGLQTFNRNYFRPTLWNIYSFLKPGAFVS